MSTLLRIENELYSSLSIIQNIDNLNLSKYQAKTLKLRCKLNTEYDVEQKLTEAEQFINNAMNYPQQQHNIVYVALDDSFYSEYLMLLEKHTLQYILENGILSLSD